MNFLNLTDLGESPAYKLIKKEQHEIKPDLGMLDPDEETRYQQYRSPSKQLEFLTGRTFLKHSLADCLAISPQSISLSLSAHGKPYLPTWLGIDVPFFNLSHTARHYVIGLSRYPIGVDIEPYRSIELSRFRHFLSPCEFKQLAELSDTERSTMFFRLFTAKEAFLKATDKGWPLDAIQFQLKDQKWQLTLPGNAFQFTQTDHEGCCLAVCVNRPDKR